MIIHRLHHGVPLCGCFRGMLPGHWPAGHSWASVDTKVTKKELKDNNAELCSTCEDKAKELKKK